MNEVEKARAIAECEALCKRYGEYADAGKADAFADLYVADGVFDRLGQKFVGREAIRRVIADRPAGIWSKHSWRNIRIELDDDGCGAGGLVDLEMQRGKAGVAEVENIRAEYHDRFALTPDGWRFASRQVVLKP